MRAIVFQVSLDNRDNARIGAGNRGLWPQLFTSIKAGERAPLATIINRFIPRIFRLKYREAGPQCLGASDLATSFVRLHELMCILLFESCACYNHHTVPISQGPHSIPTKFKKVRDVD